MVILIGIVVCICVACLVYEVCKTRKYKKNVDRVFAGDLGLKEVILFSHVEFAENLEKKLKAEKRNVEIKYGMNEKEKEVFNVRDDRTTLLSKIANIRNALTFDPDKSEAVLDSIDNRILSVWIRKGNLIEYRSMLKSEFYKMYAEDILSVSGFNEAWRRAFRFERLL